MSKTEHAETGLIEIPVGAVPWVVGSMTAMLVSQKREIDRLESIDHDHDEALEEIDRLAARIKELESLNATLSAKLMDGPQDVIAQMQVEPPALWKTPLPEGHEQWVQRMCEAPEEFVRGAQGIHHRAGDSHFFAAHAIADVGLFSTLVGGNWSSWEPLTPALRAAIDAMEVVG